MNRWPVLRGAAVMFHAASRIYGEMSGRVEFRVPKSEEVVKVTRKFVIGTPMVPLMGLSFLGMR